MIGNAHSVRTKPLWRSSSTKKADLQDFGNASTVVLSGEFRCGIMDPHDFGLEPWMGNEPTKSLGSILLAFVQCDQARPVMFAMAIVVIACSLFLRHWL